MAKYRVTLQPANIWANEVVREVIALNAKNAEDIVLTFNKDKTVVKSVRVGGEASTETVLKDITELMDSAIMSGNEDIYEQQRKAFEETVNSLKDNMNVVAWQKAEKLIPRMPIM